MAETGHVYVVGEAEQVGEDNLFVIAGSVFPEAYELDATESLFDEFTEQLVGATALSSYLETHPDN